MALKAYVSEHTQYMREWMEKHPQEASVQEKGRALWWDKPQDPEWQQQFQQAKVPVNPYYYDADH